MNGTSNDQIILVSQNGSTGIIGFPKGMDMDDSEANLGGYFLNGIYHLKAMKEFLTESLQTLLSTNVPGIMINCFPTNDATFGNLEALIDNINKQLQNISQNRNSQ